MNVDSEKKIAEQFISLVKTIAALRHPTTGCPWDLAQTFETLRRYTVEEAYEAIQAVSAGNPDDMCEEWGDLLLQVVLNAQIARDLGLFHVGDVIQGIDEKMRRRHPHVFAGTEAKTKEDVLAQWQGLKDAEKKPHRAGTSKAFRQEERVFPALRQGYEIGKRAAKIGFDWKSPDDVFAVVEGELAELGAEMSALTNQPESNEIKTRIYSELGDVFFSLIQLCRHLGVDPEVIAWDGNRKFLSRFAKMEQIHGGSVESQPLEKLEELWVKAKHLAPQ